MRKELFDATSVIYNSTLSVEDDVTDDFEWVPSKWLRTWAFAAVVKSAPVTESLPEVEVVEEKLNAFELATYLCPHDR